MTDKQRKSDRYLLRIRNAEREMKELLYQIEFLRYKASGMGAIRYDKDHVQTSPEDMVCESIAEAVHLENKLFGRSKELRTAIEFTEKILKAWQDDKYARAIEIYYLNHGSMGDIARSVKCTDRNAYRIRNEALDRFADYLYKN